MDAVCFSFDKKGSHHDPSCHVASWNCGLFSTSDTVDVPDIEKLNRKRELSESCRKIFSLYLHVVASCGF